MPIGYIFCLKIAVFFLLVGTWTNWIESSVKMQCGKLEQLSCGYKNMQLVSQKLALYCCLCFRSWIKLCVLIIRSKYLEAKENAHLQWMEAIGNRTSNYSKPINQSLATDRAEWNTIIIIGYSDNLCPVVEHVNEVASGHIIYRLKGVFGLAHVFICDSLLKCGMNSTHMWGGWWLVMRCGSQLPWWKKDCLGRGLWEWAG